MYLAVKVPWSLSLTHFRTTGPWAKEVFQIFSGPHLDHLRTMLFIRACGTFHNEVDCWSRQVIASVASRDSFRSVCVVFCDVLSTEVLPF